MQATTRDERLPHSKKPQGKISGDHAGHLIGDRFGGSPKIDNIVAQSSETNLSTFKRIENEWGRALDEGRNVSVEIEVVYQGNSTRPSSFNIEYTIDGVNTTTIINN